MSKSANRWAHTVCVHALALGAVVLLALGACGGVAPAVLAPGGPGTISAPSLGEEQWAERVLELTNAVRGGHGLQPLVLDAGACSVAYEHCWDMDLRDYFDHANPDGERARDRFVRHGMPKPWVGENLARHQATPEEVVQAWLDSPSHRENLLYPWWTHVGIAVHTRTGAGPWWTADYFYEE